jgi:DNA-binding transcriptional regulator YiaG
MSSGVYNNQEGFTPGADLVSKLGFVPFVSPLQAEQQSFVKPLPLFGGQRQRLLRDDFRALVHGSNVLRPEGERKREAPRVAQMKTIRRALKLSQEEFAASFHIPIGTLRDWEQDRKARDAAARANLRVIANEPDAVRKALDLLRGAYKRLCLGSIAAVY